jgi:hypothetical protein
METVTGAGEAAEPEVFARNTLQIAVPAGNPGDVTGLPTSPTRPRHRAVRRAGALRRGCRRVFEASGVVPSPDTLEQDVKAALSKVTLGEVDAALVYRTDVLAQGTRSRASRSPRRRRRSTTTRSSCSDAPRTRVRRRRSSTTSCPRRGSGSLSRPGSTVPDRAEDGRPGARTRPPRAARVHRAARPAVAPGRARASPSSSCRSSRWSCAPRGARSRPAADGRGRAGAAPVAGQRAGRHAALPACSASRSPGCWPVRASAAAGSCAPW